MNKHLEPIAIFDKTLSGVGVMFHDALVQACRDGGRLPEELADLFCLKPAPAGSRYTWVLDWIEEA